MSEGARGEKESFGEEENHSHEPLRAIGGGESDKAPGPPMTDRQFQKVGKGPVTAFASGFKVRISIRE